MKTTTYKIKLIEGDLPLLFFVLYIITMRRTRTSKKKESR
nr:MAG TPA: hypothetical protein [Caudoviricetes sp.]